MGIHVVSAPHMAFKQHQSMRETVLAKAQQYLTVLYRVLQTEASLDSKSFKFIFYLSPNVVQWAVQKEKNKDEKYRISNWSSNWIQMGKPI